jgi:hypothetical protein
MVCDDVEYYFRKGPRDPDEGAWHRGELRPGDEVEALEYIYRGRTPNCVASIGDGRGALSFAVANKGTMCVAVEPSKAQKKLLQKTKRRFGFSASPRTFNGTFGEFMAKKREFDTLVFCSSLEHIPPDEFWSVWPQAVEQLLSVSGRLVITNWPNYHPITVSGDYHVFAIDDAVYDRIVGDRQLVLRWGSHLVVDFIDSSHPL